jgi:hypothetical protein
MPSFLCSSASVSRRLRLVGDVSVTLNVFGMVYNSSFSLWSSLIKTVKTLFAGKSERVLATLLVLVSTIVAGRHLPRARRSIVMLHGSVFVGLAVYSVLKMLRRARGAVSHMSPF